MAHPFKVGQWVSCINAEESNWKLTKGKSYVISQSTDRDGHIRLKDVEGSFYAHRFQPVQPFSIKATMKDILSALKGFINENRNVFFWLATAFLLDHFLFKGAFRERFKNIVEGMIKKVEDQIK